MKFSLSLGAIFLAGRTAAQNIVDLGLASPETFSTLTDLVIAADLAEALSTTQNITLFAPTNDAFAELPSELVELLLTEEWKLHLQNILTLHVADTLFESSMLVNSESLTSLNGAPLEVGLDTGLVTVSGGLSVANVTAFDIMADNGIVHVIDGVLLPVWVNNTIVDFVLASPALSQLAGIAASQPDIVETLSSPGPFTVFAPNDEAFGSAPSLDESQVATVLTYHVVPGIYTASDISDGAVLTTAQGEDITFSIDDAGGVFVNGAQIVATDFLTNNGVVHVINGVLIPAAAGGTTPPEEGAPTMASEPGAPTMAPEPGAPTMAPAPSSASRAFPAAAAVTALFAGGLALAL